MAKRQFNLYLDKDLIKTVRHGAIEAEHRLSDYVADALRSNIADKRNASELTAGEPAAGAEDT